VLYTPSAIKMAWGLRPLSYNKTGLSLGLTVLVLVL